MGQFYLKAFPLPHGCKNEEQQGGCGKARNARKLHWLGIGWLLIFLCRGGGLLRGIPLLCCVCILRLPLLRRLLPYCLCSCFRGEHVSQGGQLFPCRAQPLQRGRGRNVPAYCRNVFPVVVC